MGMSECKTTIPQASNADRPNLADDSDRGTAPVVVDGPTDFGGDQAHEEVNRRRKEELARLGEQIRDLLSFITPKHNVHGDIKKKVNLMTSTYNRLLKLEQNLVLTTVGPQKLATATQTSPRLGTTIATPASHNNQEERTKRKQISPLAETRAAKKAMRRKERSREEQEQQQPLELHPSQLDLSEQPDAKWVTVQRKKPLNQQQQQKQQGQRESQNQQKQQKQRSRPGLPNALIIERKGDLSYAEILSKVKKEASLQEVGEGVEKIRKTMRGDIILVLNKASQEKASQFRTAVEGVIGAEATVRSWAQETQIEIKDLDEVTTKEEIIQALVNMTEDQGLETKAIKSIRQTYGGTKTAVVMLPEGVAKKVTKVGKLRVSWVDCRVSELVKPTKCYKCWQYGHLAWRCNSPVDRSKACIKCGTDGHKADKCTAEPRCILCYGERDGEAVKHSAGSSKCPAYKKAYQALIQKR